MWAVVDGPWKLNSFAETGNVVFVPNSAYSGPQKAQVQDLTLVAEADVATETAQLEAGALTSGYVLPSQVSAAPKPGVAGKNLLSQLKNKFVVRTGGSWGFYYAYYNFNSASSGTHLPNQLYFRQAMQYGIDQVTIIKHLYNGYGIPGYGPIPTLPANAFSGGLVNHYAYSIAKGKALLKTAGWTGSSAPLTCTKTGGCGAGVPKGTKLEISYEYATGSPTQDATMAVEKSAWASEGIKVDLTTDTPDNVAATCTSGPGSAPTSGNPNGNGAWQICQYGGWLYAPDYYPSGELLFETGALSNPGMYSDSKMDTLIAATTTGTAALNAKDGYAQYAMDQLPYMYQMTGTGTSELSTKLKGFLPVSPMGASLPEYLHF
jgi:peptide/nickel transport system substrate-binding protein